MVQEWYVYRSIAFLIADLREQESKLFDITNSLADIMIYVPSLNQQSRFDVGPRDLLHTLSTLLGSFRGGNPTVINVLQEKLSALGISISSPQGRLIDLAPSEIEQDEKTQIGLHCLPLSDNTTHCLPLQHHFQAFNPYTLRFYLPV